MQQAMDEAAAEVWGIVPYSRQHHSPTPLRLGEVTLTELNFYRLRNYWTKQVFLRAHEPTETKTGADWEWVIGHDDKWIAIRVQAKVLGTDKRVGNSPHLPHIVGNSGIRQIDLLADPIPDTTPCRWMPLYVFYASAPPLTGFPWTSPGDARYGCSTAHARAVRQILDHNTIIKRNYKAVPDTHARLYLGVADRWSSIFDPLVSQLKANQSLARIVDRLHNQTLPRSSLRIADFWMQTRPLVHAATRCRITWPQLLSAATTTSPLQTSPVWSSKPLSRRIPKCRQKLRCGRTRP